MLPGNFDNGAIHVGGTVKKMENGLSMETYLAGFEPCPKDQYGSTCMPIYQTATFQQTEGEIYDYTRSGNPTRSALEHQISVLEGVSMNGRGFAFSTGMAAISTVVRLAKQGEEIIAGDDSYGGTYRLLSQIIASRHGIKVSYMNLAGEEGVENLRLALMRSDNKVRLVMIESPTSPFQKICDIKSLAKLCHENASGFPTLLSVDNTLMSPVLCRPLELGADIVIHSGTKFLCGHSDTMAGVVTVRDVKVDDDKNLPEEIYFLQNAEGNGLAPFDCWLILRGLKTMALRVKQQQANAMIIAKWLLTCSRITKVIYPGLEGQTGYELHRAQSNGPGSVICFLTGNYRLSEHIAKTTKCFKITVSFGSVSSLMSLPGKMSHASIPEDVRVARAFPDDLVRLSIGIEDPEDLINDLSAAINSFTG